MIAGSSINANKAETTSPSLKVLKKNYFDDKNYIFFVHYRDENKVYCHHLVLIDKETLEPILISENPIFREEETEGYKNGVLYLMSHTRINDSDWIFSFGFGDYNTKLIKIKHEELINQIQPI